MVIPHIQHFQLPIDELGAVPSDRYTSVPVVAVHELYIGVNVRSAAAAAGDDRIANERDILFALQYAPVRVDHKGEWQFGLAGRRAVGGECTDSASLIRMWRIGPPALRCSQG